MTDLIKSYEPAHSEDQLYLWLGILVGLVAWGGVIFVIRKKFAYEEQNKKWLIALLLFILALLASGTALFSWLSQEKVGSVRIYADRLEIGKTEIDFERIKKINMQKEKETSFVNPNIVKEEYNLLFIEDLDGHLYVVSEQSYPVREIMNELRSAVEEWRNK